ncbi:MAG: radical SAM protein [candidate division WOR-3 bacterium]|nr:MAG: radical SAM protein [candidate division WOR-3 bacterium]
MEYRFVKDMKDIRGFKNVLNIDFSPKKTCTYDCVNCVAGRTNFLIGERKEFHPAEDIFDEIKSYIDDKGAPDYIMLTGSGEPTLYAGFGRLVTSIKGEFKDVKAWVYTNFSLLHRDEVRKEAALCDMVWGNLNTVIEEEFMQMYRPHVSVTLKNVMEGIRKFKAEYKGNFAMDTRFLKGINDSEKNVSGLREFVTSVNPGKYDILDAKYGGQPLSEDFVRMVKEKFAGVSFTIEFHI